MWNNTLVPYLHHHSKRHWKKGNDSSSCGRMLMLLRTQAPSFFQLCHNPEHFHVPTPTVFLRIWSSSQMPYSLMQRKKQDWHLSLETKILKKFWRIARKFLQSLKFCYRSRNQLITRKQHADNWLTPMVFNFDCGAQYKCVFILKPSACINVEYDYKWLWSLSDFFLIKYATLYFLASAIWIKWSCDPHQLGFTIFLSAIAGIKMSDFNHSHLPEQGSELYEGRLL